MVYCHHCLSEVCVLQLSVWYFAMIVGLTKKCPQNTTQKAIDSATRNPLYTEMNSGAPEGLAVSAPLVAPVVLLFNDTTIDVLINKKYAMLAIN